jgi:hypothetical protein
MEKGYDVHILVKENLVQYKLFPENSEGPAVNPLWRT